MQKLFTLFFIFCSFISFSQIEIVEEKALDTIIYQKDSINYEKNINYAKKRNFNSTLKEKYKGKEFEYIDDIKKPKPKPKSKPKKPVDTSFAKELIGFLSSIFPYVLG